MNQTVVSNGSGERLDLLVRQEELILDVTDRLTEALDNAGITKGELAERLGKSLEFVSLTGIRWRKESDAEDRLRHRRCAIATTHVAVRA